MTQGRVLEYLMVMVSSPLGIGGVGKDGLGFPRNVHLLDDVMALHKPHSMVQDQWHEGKCMDSLFPHLFHYRKPA